MSKILFAPVDGLAPTEALSIALYGPDDNRRTARPSTASREEIWIKLPPAENTYLFLGSQVQPMPANVAFLSPVTGKTTHSILNLSDRAEAWIGTNRLKEGRVLRLGEVSLVQPSVAPKPLKAEQ